MLHHLAQNGHPALITADSLTFSFGLGALLLQIIATSLLNTKAYRVLHILTLDFYYLFWSSFLFVFSFGIKFFARGWVAFGILCALSVAMIIHTSIWYLKAWYLKQVFYTLVIGAVCYLLLSTINLLALIALTLALVSFFLIKKRSTAFFSCLLFVASLISSECAIFYL